MARCDSSSNTFEMTLRDSPSLSLGSSSSLSEAEDSVPAKAQVLSRQDVDLCCTSRALIWAEI